MAQKLGGYSLRPVRTAILVLLLSAPASIASPELARAGVVTWGTGWPTVSGTPATLSLGGGSTVDVTVTTGGAQGLSEGSVGPLGAVETGLDYSQFNYLGIFNGGGDGNVTTTLTFTNFVPGPHHVRGLLMIGQLDERSVPVTLTSSVGGAVQTWSQVGNTFPMGAGNSDPTTWNAASGQISTPLDDDGNDSSGIVLDIGSLSQYGTITVTLSQALPDGVSYAIGVETAPVVVPVASGPALGVLAALLTLTGARLAGRLRRPIGATL